MNANTWKTCGYLLLFILIIVGIINILPVIIIGGIVLWIGITIWGYIKSKRIRRNSTYNTTSNYGINEDNNHKSDIKIDKSNVVDVDYTDIK